MEEVRTPMMKMPKPVLRDIDREVCRGLVSLRIEKLSGKVILEKDADMVMRNFVRIMYFLFANYESASAPSITITDTGGNARTGYIQASAVPVLSPREAGKWYNQGALAGDTKGILIGIGTISPTRTDYNLVSKIAHGTGAGQIYHNQQTYELLSDYQFRLNREFTNAGSNLAVTESGLIYDVTIASTIYQFLLLRDAFSAVNVTTGNGIRVRYTWSF